MLLAAHNQQLTDQFVDVRTLTERLTSRLSAEDQTAQSMPDASPAKLRTVELPRRRYRSHRRRRRRVDEPRPMGVAQAAKASPAGNETLVSTTPGWRMVNQRMLADTAAQRTFPS